MSQDRGSTVVCTCSLPLWWHVQRHVLWTKSWWTLMLLLDSMSFYPSCFCLPCLSGVEFGLPLSSGLTKKQVSERGQCSELGRASWIPIPCFCHATFDKLFFTWSPTCTWYSVQTSLMPWGMYHWMGVKLEGLRTSYYIKTTSPAQVNITLNPTDHKQITLSSLLAPSTKFNDRDWGVLFVPPQSKDDYAYHTPPLQSIEIEDHVQMQWHSYNPLSPIYFWGGP